MYVKMERFTVQWRAKIVKYNAKSCQLNDSLPLVNKAFNTGFDALVMYNSEPDNVGCVLASLFD